METNVRHINRVGTGQDVIRKYGTERGHLSPSGSSGVAQAIEWRRMGDISTGLARDRMRLVRRDGKWSSVSFGQLRSSLGRRMETNERHINRVGTGQDGTKKYGTESGHLRISEVAMQGCLSRSRPF